MNNASQPAFPTPVSYDTATGSVIGGTLGITKLEWFAAHAMQGLIADPNASYDFHTLRATSYAIAHAMLEEPKTGVGDGRTTEFSTSTLRTGLAGYDAATGEATIVENHRHDGPAAEKPTLEDIVSANAQKDAADGLGATLGYFTEAAGRSSDYVPTSTLYRVGDDGNLIVGSVVPVDRCPHGTRLTLHCPQCPPLRRGYGE